MSRKQNILQWMLIRPVALLFWVNATVIVREGGCVGISGVKVSRIESVVGRIPSRIFHHGVPTCKTNDKFVSPNWKNDKFVLLSVN